MELNNRIFDLLEAQGKKAIDLANYLGLKSSSLTGWKTEGSYPSSKHIKKISDFLDVSIEYLVTGSNLSPKDLTSDQQELLALYSRLDEVKQAKVKGYMQALTDS